MDLTFLQPKYINFQGGSIIDTQDHYIRHCFDIGKRDLAETFLKDCCTFAKTDSYVIPTNSTTIAQIFDASEKSRIQRFHDIISQLLSDNRNPRQYRYAPDYTGAEKFSPKATKNNSDKIFVTDSDKLNFYALTKLYEFFTAPPAYFRTPFSIGSLNNQTYLHPGNFRLMATLFLKSFIPCVLFVRTNNLALINKLPVDIKDYKSILSSSVPELKSNLHLQRCKQHLCYRYSSITGIQIVEHHPFLDEYRKDYEIAWTGRQFVVNDVIIAELKNNIFIPPDPIRY